MEKLPEFRAGDLIKIYSKIVEGGKERVTSFQGVVIQVRGAGRSKTFTVRKTSGGVGVERIFPLDSPNITKVEVKKKGKVRRAKLFYLRGKKGKEAKIREAGVERKPGSEAVAD